MAGAGDDPVLPRVDLEGDTPVFDVDSPSPPGDNENDGDPDVLGSYQNTVQYDETQPLDDDFTLEAEAFGNVASLAGETQVFDGADVILDDCNEGVAVSTDSEGGDHSDVFLSDDEDESIIRDLDTKNKQTKEIGQPGSCIVSHKKMESSYVSSGSAEVAKGRPPLSLSSNSHGSASGVSQGTKRSFTAIRSASLRAAGLAAARSMSSHVDNVTLCNSSDKIQCQQIKDFVETPLLGFNNPTGVEMINVIKDVPCTELVVDKSGSHEDNSKGNLRDKVKSARARKLFVEDTEVDMEFHSMAEQNVAGLSYVDSQEPGESAQELALNIVDKFLNVNDVDSQEDSAPFRRSSNPKKSPPSSMLKGKLSLALRTNPGNPVQNGEVYDWIDSLEDEGGGDFFTKKKDMLLGSGEPCCKSKCEPRGQKHISKRAGGIGKALEDEKGGPQIHQRSLGLLPQKLKEVDDLSCRTETKENTAKADEQLIAEPQNDPNSSDCVPDIGINTQLAAEAMEALCCEPPMECEKMRKEFHLSDVGQTNEGPPLKKTSRKHASLVSGTRPATRSSKNLEVFINPPCLTLSKGLSKEIAARKKAEDSEKSHMNMLSKSPYEKNCSISPNRTSNKRANLHFDSGRLEGVIPVAHRTRQSVRSVSGKGIKRRSNGTDQVENHEFRHTIPKKQRSTVVAVAHILLDPQGEYSTSDTCQKEVSGKGRRSKSVKRVTEELKIGKSPVNEVQNDTSDCHHGKTGVQMTVEETDEDRSTWEGSSKDKLQTPSSANAVSPVCMGDNSSKLLGKIGSSKFPLLRELTRLDVTKMLPFSATKKSSRRREMSNVCVLLSNHLGNTMVKKLTKIMARLGIPAATSALEATHFVADEFVRTKNMLEAMALGKPVVTHLWLQRCGQANCYIDEKDYILRDHKKEKDIGFNMTNSLARASQHPLLQGKRVLVTPNAKPNRELLAGLVKAVQGQPVKRLGRSTLKDDMLPDDLLIISCEEDYSSCVPLLEKGAEVYNSELLLNGIVIQKLEYRRHQLFVDNVKKTRSTIWIRNESDKQYRSVKRITS